jgi:hypothetical protein
MVSWLVRRSPSRSAGKSTAVQQSQVLLLGSRGYGRAGERVGIREYSTLDNQSLVEYGRPTK